MLRYCWRAVIIPRCMMQYTVQYLAIVYAHHLPMHCQWQTQISASLSPHRDDYPLNLPSASILEYLL